jgi:TetR/AcrR family transcriptional regulator, regulator of autoinduction and epiphytic fitness
VYHPDVATVKRRTYRSTIRRGDAPRLICAAAHRLFSTKGYLATSMDEIAAEAGVARPTVFTAVGPKPAILKAVVDQAMAGDDAPVPVAERPWFKEAIDEPDPARSLQLHARNLCWIMQRVVPLYRALETAAAIDEDAAEQWAELRRQRRVGTAGVAANLAAKATLRCQEQVLADMLLTLPPDAYYRLVHEEGWSIEAFQRWLADLLQRVCLP